MAQPKIERMNGIMLASTIIVAVLILRLSFLQVIQGQHHAELARRNMERKVLDPAPRGLILDKNGEIIARNQYRYEVGLQIKPGVDWQDDFDFLADFFQWDDEPDKDGLSQQEKKYNQVKSHRRYQETVVLETNITKEQMFELEEIKWNYPTIEIIKRPIRYYDEGSLFPQLVQGMKNDGTPHNNSLESHWDEYLRGTDGFELWAVNSRSVPRELLGYQEAIPGNNIVLTIDTEFQKYVQKSLADGIEKNQLGQKQRGAHPPGRHGAAIVLDIKTGDILAMASYPSYDVEKMYSNDLIKELQEIDDILNKNYNFGNRKPTQTSRDIFWPLWRNSGAGSTIKVLTSIMALEEGVITPNQRYRDTGSYISAKERSPRPISNANGRVWGSVNLEEALTVSLNSYFCWMVDNLTDSVPGNIKVIERYTDLFGITGDTGFVDVPGQNRVGKTFHGVQSPLQFTIGADSATAVSPMHMANFVSMVANKGYHYRPRLVKHIEDPNGNIIEEFEPEIYRNVPHDVVSKETYDVVIDAMKSVTKPGGRISGTSAAAFAGFPIEVAAKTGSAHAATGDAHAWWMGFAPADEPEIAVVVFTEHGGMNSHTHFIARSIMDEYFGFNKSEQDQSETNGQENTETEIENE